MINHLRSRLSLMLTLLPTLALCPACGLTLGPTTEVRYLIVHPGQPMRVMEQATLTGERLDGGGTTTVDVAGWVMMPPDHWAVVQKVLEKSQPAVAPATK